MYKMAEMMAAKPITESATSKYATIRPTLAQENVQQQEQQQRSLHFFAPPTDDPQE